MSLDAAVSRIGQILAAERQIAGYPVAASAPSAQPASAPAPGAVAATGSFSSALTTAQASQSPASVSPTGYSLPLDARYMTQLGRTDDGVDIETAPDGATVYSMTSGVVTAVASDPSGFGPNYPVIKVTSGPLAGRYIYYGHVASSLVHVGQVVSAGQPIAIMGHTGDAAGLGHGHIEIGFSDAGGDPVNHHGSSAWTQSGDEMRRLLIAISAQFGVNNS